MDRLRSQYAALSSSLSDTFSDKRDSDVPLDDSDSAPFMDDGQDATRSRRRSLSPFPGTLRRMPRRRLFVLAGVAVFVLFAGFSVFSRRSAPARSRRTYIQEAYGSDAAYIPPSETPSLPQIAPYNVYDRWRPQTPMFIAFTRNHAMLEQTVLSYIAAGWPPEEIIVVDNSGTMNANKRKKLSLKNPFYLNYEKLNRFGVSILRTPTLLSFAQLQNFFIAQALNHDWDYYFWSHMDIVIMSDELTRPYKSAYQRVVEELTAHLKRWNQLDRAHPKSRRWNSVYPPGVKKTDWAVRYFAYDWLTLVNTRAMERVGGYDVFIPYYTTDCDFIARVKMSGLEISEGRIGKIFDVAGHFPEPEKRLFPKPGEAAFPGSERYKKLNETLTEMEIHKKANDRNFWQNEMKGGKGEPWTYDPKAFHQAWWIWDEYGRQVYQKKWKLKEYNRQCVGLVELGKTLDDAW